MPTPTLPPGLQVRTHIRRRAGAGDIVAIALQSLFNQREINPERTLYVAKSWPANAETAFHFTTIQSAITAAAALTPLVANPVTIYVHPGTYTENVVLVSNVNIIGIAETGVLINGNISWLAGQGVNASQAALSETISWSNITLNLAGSSFTFDSTAKTASSSQFSCMQSVFRTMAFTGRGTNVDNSFFYDCIFVSGTSTYTFTNMTGSSQNVGVDLVGTRIRGLALAGNTIARIQGGESIFVSGNVWALTGTATLKAMGLDLENNITVASGCSFTAPGCVVSSAITINAASGGTADVRGSNCLSTSLAGLGTLLADNMPSAPATLSGAGTLNIVKATTLFTSTGAGNAIVLPNGTFQGQQHTVVHTVKGTSGTGVITPAAAGNFTNVTLTNHWEAATFEWSGAAWNVIMANPVAIVA